jgi:hypothetical protein
MGLQKRSITKTVRPNVMNTAHATCHSARVSSFIGAAPSKTALTLDLRLVVRAGLQNAAARLAGRIVPPRTGGEKRGETFR